MTEAHPVHANASAPRGATALGLLRVHLAHVLDGVIERVAGGHVHHLLRLDCGGQERVVRGQRLQVVGLILEKLLYGARPGS